MLQAQIKRFCAGKTNFPSCGKRRTAETMQASFRGMHPLFF
jgi:hypothetical protein